MDIGNKDNKVGVIDDLSMSAVEYAEYAQRAWQEARALKVAEERAAEAQAAGKALEGLKALSRTIQKDDDPDKDYDDPTIDRLFNTQGLWIGLYPQEHVAYRLERFIQEYLKDYDAPRAVVACGYCDGSLGEGVVRARGALLRRTLRKQIRLRADNIAHQCGITAEKIMREMAGLAFSNIGDYLSPGGFGAVKDISSIPRALLGAIKEISVDQIFEGRGDDKTYTGDRVKLKLHDKMEALKLLGGHIKAIDLKPEPGNGQEINITFVSEGSLQERRVKRVESVERVAIDGGRGLLSGIVDGGGNSKGEGRAGGGGQAGLDGQEEEADERGEGV